MGSLGANVKCDKAKFLETLVILNIAMAQLRVFEQDRLYREHR